MKLQPAWKRCAIATLASLLAVSGTHPFTVHANALSPQNQTAETPAQRLTDRRRYLLEAALQSAERINSSYSRQRSIITIANTYQKLGEHDRALALLQQIDQSENSRSTSNDVRLAESYITLGQFNRADQLLQEAIATLPAQRWNWSELFQIAIAYGQFSDSQKVEQRLESIYDFIPRKLESPPLNHALTLSGLASAYSQIEDSELVNLGLERLSKLVSSHLNSIHPKSGLGDDFFAQDEAFYRLTAAELDQRGGGIYQSVVTNYMLLLGKLSSIYREQGNQELAEEHLEKALVLWRLLPDGRKLTGFDVLFLKNSAREAKEQGNPTLPQQVLTELEARSPRDQSEPYSLVSRQTSIAIAYSQIEDQTNADRILKQLLQDIQSLADKAESPIAQQNAYGYINDIARAYAKIGNEEMQQFLLRENFEALLSIEVNENAASEQLSPAIVVKRQILNDVLFIYSEISDDSLAREQLIALQTLANDADFDRTKVYVISDLAVAAAKRKSFPEAERFAQAAIAEARLLPDYDSSHLIALADAVSHLDDPGAIRSGLGDIERMTADLLALIDEQTQVYDIYDVDRLHRRVMQTYLQGL